MVLGPRRLKPHSSSMCESHVHAAPDGAWFVGRSRNYKHGGPIGPCPAGRLADPNDTGGWFVGEAAGQPVSGRGGSGAEVPG